MTNLSFIKENNLVINTEISHYDSLLITLNKLQVPVSNIYMGKGKPQNLTLRFDFDANYNNVTNHFDKKQQIRELYALVFFLKDFGLEYTYPFDPRKEKYTDTEGKLYYYPKFFLGDYVECEANLDVNPFAPTPLHISDFLTIHPINQLFRVNRRFFREYCDEVRYTPTYEETPNYSEDTLNFGFGGDASNYWNID